MGVSRLPRRFTGRSALFVFTLTAASFFLSATGASQSAAPVPWYFPTGQMTWFGTTFDFDNDGSEELILSTMDQGRHNAVTPATPIYALGVADGVVFNRTDTSFATPPMSFWARTLVKGDFNGDGQTDLFICSQGREPGDWRLAPLPRVNGVWGEQNQLWLNDSGVLVDHTVNAPQTIDFSHGCSAGDVDRSGRDSLLVNNLGTFPPYQQNYLASWRATGLTVTTPYVSTGTAAAFGFYTAAGDFDRNGYADIMGDRHVVWGGPTGRSVRSLPASQLDSTTFGDWQGTTVADLTGDGLPDVVKVLSSKAPGLVGARFVLFTSDGQGNMVEKLDAFPAIGTYGAHEFGLNLTVIDVNFDGFPDITTFGRTYTYGTTLTVHPRALWLNDGTGRFRLAHFADQITGPSGCGGRGGFGSVYFLKTADPAAYNLVIAGCFTGIPTFRFATRRVTPDDPMTIVVAP